ncbi:MAG: RNA methyltransferase [Porphyromonas sp.]|nr:RNA methyltransferase [Bacteroidales bacterium]MDY3100759.1 RNA methyltransferase [Porphyromonas sp.]
MPRKLKITEMERLTAEEFRVADKTALVLILDNVRSLNNVGSLFRTADALRLEKICLCGITGRPPHPELHKTALGAEEVVEWAYYADTIDAVTELKKEGAFVLALEQAEGSVDIRKLSALSLSDKPHVALVAGNEVDGVAQAVIDLCDATIEIPQKGTKHSLNVSVAGGIALWELYKQLDHNPQYRQ